MGFRAGLRIYWAELQVGADTDVFSSRDFFGVKLAPLASQVLSPYAYARIGTWSEDEILADHRGGDYRAAGGGLDLNASEHFFLFGEGGVGQRRGEQSTDTHAYAEVHLGLGVRF